MTHNLIVESLPYGYALKTNSILTCTKYEQTLDTFDETYFLPDLCNRVEMEHLKLLH